MLNKKSNLLAVLVCVILLGSSIPSSAQTAPPSPTLNNAAAGNRQVTLDWTQTATAAGYKVKYGTASGVYPNVIDAGNVISFIVNSLTNNTPYYFVVTAYNAGGESGPSNELSAQPFSVTAAYSSDLCNNGTSNASSCLQGCASAYSHTKAFDNVFNVWDGWVAAGVPTGWLQYTFSSPETITKYTINPRGAVAGNPRNWTFEAYDAANSQWVVLDTKVNQIWTYQVSNEHTFNNANAYTQYRLNISANGGHNEVGLTEVEMMRLVTPGAPSAVTNLQAQATNASVTLTWSEPASNGSPITSYQVQYGPVNSGAFNSTYIDNNVPGATINGLANNTTYQFRVVAVNALSNSDPSNTVNGTPTNGTIVSGPIAANTTWTLTPTPPQNNGSPYVVTSDITINPGVTLTIQPGVEVKFAGNFKMTVNGTLNAAGTSSQNIRFTSSQAAPAPGDWKSITINGPTGNGSVLDFVTVEYGGNTAGANIYLEQSSPTITNSTIAYSSDFAVTCYSFTGGTCYPAFANNTYTNNAKNAVRYFGDIYHSGTLNKANAPYVVTGDILVKDYFGTVIWTIGAGVEFRFDAGKSINVGLTGQNGGLTVQGTVSEPVIFTSNQPQGTQTPGYWPGINLIRGPMTIDHAQIEYADKGVNVTSGSSPYGSPTVQNSTFQHNNNGVYFEPSTGPNILNNTITNNNNGIFAGCNVYSGCNPTITNNDISNNTINLLVYSYTTDASKFRINAANNWWGSNDPNVIVTTIQDFLDDSTLPAVDFDPFLDAPGGNPNTIWNNRLFGHYQDRTLGLTNSPYIAIRNVVIEPTKTFTVAPGVEVRFDNNYQLLVKGALNSAGTSGNTIRFTSNAATPAAADWAGIRIEGGTPASTIDYTEIKYADTGLYIYYGSPPVSNSSFQNNNIGITMVGTSTSLITNNVFDNNVNYGMQLLSGLTVPPPTPEIHNNSFLNNMQYDLRTDMTGINFNHSGTIIDAEYNWWGTADPVQISASIYDYFDQNYRPRVDYAPYLVVPPGQSIFITNNSVTRRFFNPVRSETAQINYTLSEAADVTIRIFDNSQTLVRTLLNNQPKSSGSNSDVWDGRDDNAQLLPDGTYKYTIYASNASGHAGLYDPFDPIQREANISNVSISPAASFNPSKGERLRIQYDLNAPARVTLKFAFYSPYVDNELRDAGTNIDYWDGRSDDGSILDLTTPGAVFEVQATNTQVLEPNIIVLKQSTTLDVPVLVTDPYVIRPLYNEITEITYAITGNATVSVSILTPDGNTVLTVLEGPVSKTAGTYTLVWDGRTSSGAMVTDDGDYRVQVQGIDSSGVSFIRDGNIRIMY